MARRRRKKDRRDERQVQRDDYYIASSLLDEPAYRPVRRAVEPSVTLLDIEDRRRWDPEGEYRPARSLLGPASVIEVTGGVGAGGRVARSRSAPRGRPYRSPFYDFPPGRMQFDVPRRVAVCVRRKQRREVLFAKRRTGKGSRAPRTRDYWSDVSCGR